MKRKPLGLYIHIPFCKSKCRYCDFCSFPHPLPETVSRYVSVLCDDLCRHAGACRIYEVETVYFGGGTPTLLSAHQWEQILQTVVRYYTISPHAEITAECNPATGDFSLFEKMRRLGVNRMSVGLQSARNGELRALGRIHTAEDFGKTYEEIRRAGFENVSFDVMFGLPGQTVESYLKTLEKASDLAPEHLSAYGLTVEEGTPFFAMQQAGKLVLPDEEETRRMYLDGMMYLKSRGYVPYEISNFARPGYESRHNLKYWNGDAFLGFGPAAYSDFEGRRFGYSNDLDAYLNGEKKIADGAETPSGKERQDEYVMLRMRLFEGISAKEFRERFGEDFFADYGTRLEKYIPMGLVKRTSDGYAFTPEGMYVSNAVLSDILDFPNIG